MSNFNEKLISARWKNILCDYEDIKKKKSKIFNKVEDLCNVHKISRKQLNKYYRRWLISGKEDYSLIPKKRGPNKGAYRLLNKDEERIIIKIQRKFESKPIDIWSIINKKEKLFNDIHPSVRTIGRILKRYSTNKKKKIIHRYEKNIPGELIHVDSFYIPKEIFKDKKQRYLQGYIDDCTRLIYVDIIDNINSIESIKTLLKAGTWFNIHGIEIEKIMTDNGTEFTKTTKKINHNYEILLELIKIKHIYTRIGRPQTNGKIERFWRILREEFLLGLKDLELNDFLINLQKFIYFYNYNRLHGSLGYKTPFEKLSFVTETLS